MAAKKAVAPKKKTPVKPAAKAAGTPRGGKKVAPKRKK